jgi:hypothetical protein
MGHWKQEKQELERQLEEARKQLEAAKNPTSDASGQAPASDELQKAIAEKERLEKELSEAKSKLSGRPATKPWDKHDGAYRPFRRNFFAINKKKEWQERFVSPENVETAQAKGYEIAPSSDYTLRDKVIEDGKPVDGKIVRRGMILMRKRREDYEEEQRLNEEQRKRTRRLKRLGEVQQAAESIGEKVIEYVKE